MLNRPTDGRRSSPGVTLELNPDVHYLGRDPETGALHNAMVLYWKPTDWKPTSLSVAEQ